MDKIIELRAKFMYMYIKHVELHNIKFYVRHRKFSANTVCMYISSKHISVSIRQKEKN